MILESIQNYTKFKKLILSIKFINLKYVSLSVKSLDYFTGISVYVTENVDCW